MVSAADFDHLITGSQARVSSEMWFCQNLKEALLHSAFDNHILVFLIRHPSIHPSVRPSLFILIILRLHAECMKNIGEKKTDLCKKSKTGQLYQKHAKRKKQIESTIDISNTDISMYSFISKPIV